MLYQPGPKARAEFRAFTKRGGPVMLEVEPLAFAPLRLISPDGRVSHFPRAMCRLRCADGRGGLGWLEWNLNQPRPEAGAAA